MIVTINNRLVHLIMNFLWRGDANSSGLCKVSWDTTCFLRSWAAYRWGISKLWIVIYFWSGFGMLGRGILNLYGSMSVWASTALVRGSRWRRSTSCDVLMFGGALLRVAFVVSCHRSYFCQVWMFWLATVGWVRFSWTFGLRILPWWIFLRTYIGDAIWKTVRLEMDVCCCSGHLATLDLCGRDVCVFQIGISSINFIVGFFSHIDPYSTLGWHDVFGGSNIISCLRVTRIVFSGTSIIPSRSLRLQFVRVITDYLNRPNRLLIIHWFGIHVLSPWSSSLLGLCFMGIFRPKLF